MAELAIAIVLPLLQQGIPAALRMLKNRSKQARATDVEVQELKDFSSSVELCLISCVDAKKVLVTSSFANTLREVRNALSGWGEQSSGFFQKSPGDRLEDMRALRRKFDSAVSSESFKLQIECNRMMVSMYEHIKEQSPRRPGPARPLRPVQDPHHNSAARENTLPRDHTTGSKGGSNAPTHGRSDSTGRARPRDRNSHSSRSRSVEPQRPLRPVQDPHHNTAARENTLPRDHTTGSKGRSNAPTHGRSHSTGQVRSRDRNSHGAGSSVSSRVGQQHPHRRTEKRRKVELWAPFDSEMQANALQNKLRGIQGVDSVFCELFNKQVIVTVKEAGDVRIDTLLAAARDALPRDKVTPKRWSERPK